jgi:GST-like protein
MPLHLYTWPTPNGQKVQILLEELGVPYEVHPVDIYAGDQFSDAYLALNPNNKVPTLVDDDGPEGRPFTVFESGANLADKYDRFRGQGAEHRSEVLQWVMWQMGGLGPMIGQGEHFFTYVADKLPYAIERYRNESQRLLGVMERRLRGREHLVGDDSVADIACFPWVRVHTMAGATLDDCPNVRRWYGALRARPAVQTGLKLLFDRQIDAQDNPQAQGTFFGAEQYRRRP